METVEEKVARMLRKLSLTDDEEMTGKGLTSMYVLWLCVEEVQCRKSDSDSGVAKW